MTKRTATTTAIILSVAAAGAPAAGARPAQFLPASQQSPASVYSRPDKSMIPVSPPATYSDGSGRAAALRAVAEQERDRVVAVSALGGSHLTAASDFTGPAANTASVPAAAHAAQSGFDWGDAGIGAAGGIAIVMLATGGGLFAVRMRRDHLDPATR